MYVSVYGGIADAQAYRGDVEIILIDWDNYEDNLADVDTVLYHIDLAGDLSDGYPAIWFDLHSALTRMAGGQLEEYNPQDAEMIRDALAEAGHPLPEDGERQTVLPL